MLAPIHIMLTSEIPFEFYCYYRPRSKGDDRFGSSICLCSPFEPFDLDFWQDGPLLTWDCRSRSEDKDQGHTVINSVFTSHFES